MLSLNIDISILFNEYLLNIFYVQMEVCWYTKETRKSIVFKIFWCQVVKTQISLSKIRREGGTGNGGFWLRPNWFPGAQTSIVLVLFVSKLSPGGSKLATGSSNLSSFSQLIIPVKRVSLAQLVWGSSQQRLWLGWLLSIIHLRNSSCNQKVEGLKRGPHSSSMEWQWSGEV